MINDIEMKTFRRTGREPFLPKFVTRQHQAELTAQKIQEHEAAMAANRAKHAQKEAERLAQVEAAKAVTAEKKVRTVTFSIFMGLFLLNLPCTHREIRG
eukprot:SAG31_NODE_2962_length_4846_cov_3.429956_2_plen_99_part_00